MAEQKTDGTGITWCDMTFNPIIGCTKVSPACKNCYAERDMDKRLGKVAWGRNGTRVLTSDANWRKPLKWDRDAYNNQVWHSANTYVDPPRPRLFCASLADVFEDWQGPIVNNQGMPLWICEGVDEWQAQVFPGRTDVIMRAEKCRRVTMDDIRTRLFNLIDATPNLDWLLLTKRPENIRRMWKSRSVPHSMPGYRGQYETMRVVKRDNVWLGTSIENQEYANKRIPELLKCRELAPVLFLSCEPLLGEVDLTNIQIAPDHSGVGPDAVADNLLDCLRGEICSGETGCMLKENEPSIDWVIAGGESGASSRPSHPDWFRSVRDQCQAASVPFHFKQWGEWAPDRNARHSDLSCNANKQVILRPDGQVTAGFLAYGVDAFVMNRVGKKAAGRELDGREWNEFPKVAK